PPPVARILDLIENGPAETFDFPPARRFQPWPWVAAAAAALVLVALGAVLLRLPGPDSNPVPPVAQPRTEPRELLEARLLRQQIRLAETTTPPEQVQALGAMAKELGAEL